MVKQPKKASVNKKRHRDEAEEIEPRSVDDVRLLLRKREVLQGIVSRHFSVVDRRLLSALVDARLQKGIERLMSGNGLHSIPGLNKSCKVCT